MKKFVPFLVAIGSVGLMALFLRHDPQGPYIVGIMLAIVLTIFAVQASPRLRGLIAQYPARFRIAAFVVFVLGMGAIVFFQEAYPGFLPRQAQVGAGVAVVAISILLFQLPRMRLAPPAFAPAAPNVPSPDARRFSAIGQARTAILFPFRHWTALLRKVGPWFLIYWAAQTTVILAIEPEIGIAPARGTLGAGDAILVLLVTIVTQAVCVTAAAVVWHLFVQTGDGRVGIGAFARRSWRYVWRFVIFNTLCHTFDKYTVAGIAGFLQPWGHNWVDAALVFYRLAFYLVAIWLAGPFSLILPAIAAGESPIDTQAALRLWLSLGRAYAGGLVLTILPFGLAMAASAVLASALPGYPYSLLSLGFDIVPAMAFFLAIASGATYLSQAYLHAKGREPPV
ncbi:MAG TPA: hypothetical protein VHZ78_11160 [Rhizomicrobium sp.]|nr:hypothetical protein [Rhizomicrobium sp.]